MDSSILHVEIFFVVTFGFWIFVFYFEFFSLLLLLLLCIFCLLGRYLLCMDQILFVLFVCHLLSHLKIKFPYSFTLHSQISSQVCILKHWFKYLVVKNLHLIASNEYFILVT